MSIFSEIKVNLPNGEQAQFIAASNTAVNPLLAVATNTRVLFYNDSGEKLDIEINRNLMPTSMAWHPVYSVLAVGWQNGLLTLWNGENNTTKEDANLHHAPIINITYNPNGHRMVTCDDKGTVGVWRNITLMCSYQKNGAITHCIFCDLQLDKDKEKEKDKENNKDNKENAKEEKKTSDPKDPLKDKKKTQNLFFFGGKAGVVCVADDSNHVTEVCKVSGAVKSLFFYEKMNSMIIITSSFLLVQFKISLTEKSQHDKKVRLSTTGEAEQLSSIWVGQSLVATVCAENLLRAWHLDRDENYVLTLSEAENVNKGESLMHDKIISINYDERNKLLIAGTKAGNGIFWKNMLPGNDSPYDNDQWKILPLLKLGSDPVTQVCVGKGASLIAFKYGAGISIVYETMIRGRIMENVKALQVSSKIVQLHLKGELATQLFAHKTNMNIRWLDVSSKHLLLWNGKRTEVYEIVPDIKQPKTTAVAEFNTEKTLNIWIFKEHIFLCQNYGIVVTTLNGQAKKDVTFADSEGVLRGSNRNSNFLVTYTANNYIRVFDLSRRELKQVGVTRRFEDSKGPLGENIICNINCDGSKVSIIAHVKKEEGFENVLFIYDVEVDTFTQYRFEDERSPVDTYWDQTDKRFLAVLCDNNKKVKPDEKIEDEPEKPLGTRELFTFFVSSEHGIKKQDSYPLEPEVEGLCALAVPYLNLIIRGPGGYSIEERPLKDFTGLDKIDDYTKKAIMNFGYFLSIGNMDEAYKSVKLIQNPLVWENMAQMCVKTKRLDVSETCLGNMRFARGAKLVRESKTHDAVEPQLAMLAIQLGMKEEAKKLYEECKRYDLLNQMYQATGEWDKALQVADSHDRISLTTTYFKMAKQFEISKDFEKAIEYYEKANAHRKEVPRMLLNAGEVQMLEGYIEGSQDKALFKWWAHFLESQGKLEAALKYYQMGEDASSLVRIHLGRGELNKAYEICEETNDLTACYTLAKQCEAKGQISEAIQLYAKAQQVSLAIRLAVENGMDNEIMSLTVSGPRQGMIKAASYFEAKGYNEKAIILYIKGRNYKKALDLAVRFKLFDYVERITREIDSNADPEVLAGVAEHFMENNQPGKAVHLLIASGQYQKALELCLQHNVPINEDMIEKILPNKENPSQADIDKRNSLIRMIAKSAKQMGNFELASSYYIQVGEVNKAAKCLIKLGDVNKIITFANNARNTDIYIIAANFLQTSDWHNDPNLMKHIINFYSKAKSYHHLAGFYDGCSALEIDEYRDYEKAAAALKEALKYAQKVTTADKENRIQQLQQKIFFVEKFAEAKTLAQTNPQESIKVCQQLLENPGGEYAIRAGDVYAQMIEIYYENRDVNSAYSLIKQMQQKGIILNHYLDQELLDNVFNSVGVKNTQQARRQTSNVDKFQEEEVEEINEDM